MKDSGLSLFNINHLGDASEEHVQLTNVLARDILGWVTPTDLEKDDLGANEIIGVAYRGSAITHLKAQGLENKANDSAYVDQLVDDAVVLAKLIHKDPVLGEYKKDLPQLSVSEIKTIAREGSLSPEIEDDGQNFEPNMC